MQSNNSWRVPFIGLVGTQVSNSTVQELPADTNSLPGSLNASLPAT